MTMRRRSGAFDVARILALRRLMTGPIATDFPASMLWLHSDVTCVCDADAAESL
jgi:6-phosphogluconolactonase/glucosamine-6-phosphate isomerase/deaminase